MLNIAQLQIVHEAIRDGEWIEAANLAFAAEGSDVRVETKQEALVALRALEQNLAAENKYIEYAVLLWGNVRFDSRPNAVKMVFDEVIHNHKLIIMGASSMSKCLGPDVGVRMYDGSVKKAKDVKTGDILMGDDSKPRNVLAAHSGVGPLFKIIPARGDPWICNSEHILSLRQGTKRMTHGKPSATWVQGETYDIPLKEYMSFSRFRKRCLNQYSVGVEYIERPVPFCPYVYGAWLGDGSKNGGHFASPRCGLTDYLCEYFPLIGMRIGEYPHPTAICSSWVPTAYSIKLGEKSKRNKWSSFVKESCDAEGKFILDGYLTNSRDVRLRMLAGLIDTDGCVIEKGMQYMIAATPPRLARQIYHLVRSLGFGGHIYKCKPAKNSKNHHYIITISGIGLSEIPTIDKKIIAPSNRATTNVGIKHVEPIGDGKYYGFLIDGNHRFLLEDYTVTHNTYSCGVLYYLIWRSDPYWTAIKLAGPSEDHLYGNLFSHIVGLHRSSAIPMTDDDAKLIDINETEMSIGMHDAIPEMRIQCVLCKQNQVSASGLRGHKPKPMRPTDHPKLGRMTRIYILIDEGTHVSPGAFQDIKTTEASINPNTDSVKIVMACNPEGVDYRIVELAEPEDGWDVEQVDTLFSWTSKKGYKVLRLDGKKSENVIERKIIYEGLLSYETYLDFLKSGEHSGPYWAKGRGFPPLKDNAWTVVPAGWMQSQRGEPIYIGDVKNIGIHDTALQGADKALLGVGRWGEASGWVNLKGEVTMFKDRTNPAINITKYVSVLDQIFQLPKSDNNTEITQELMGRCKSLGIPPENVVMDKTGNASGTYSHAKTYWGDILGVDFGTKADDTRVLAEDLNTAYDLYDGKVTELWFAAKRWMDPTVCAVLVNPIVPTAPLYTHMVTRRYRNVKGGRVRVEPKEEYKARNQAVSPDEADILCLLVEWCRQRGGVTPGIVEKRDRDGPGDGSERVSIENVDEVDRLDTPEWVENKLEEV